MVLWTTESMKTQGKSHCLGLILQARPERWMGCARKSPEPGPNLKGCVTLARPPTFPSLTLHMQNGAHKA